MAKSISYNTTYNRIEASGGTAEDPLTFKNIYDYFVANPLVADYDYPRRLGSNPYELCENNASEWSGLNGLGSPSNENVDFTKNSYSIKSTYSDAYTSYAGTKIYIYSNYYVMIDIASANTKFSVGDEVYISGTTDWNDLIFKVLAVSTTYIYGNLPVGYTTKPTNNSVTVTKYHQLAWNKNFTAGSFNASFCDKIKFSLKTTGANVTLKGFIVRNYYGRQVAGSGSEGYCYYGGYKNYNTTINGTWQDFEINIRDLIFYEGHDNNDARNYWGYIDRIIFLFDGLQSTESVLVDGLRFTASNRNPQKIGENAFIFPVPLYVSSYFSDWGFNVQFNMIECLAANETSSTVYNGVYFDGATDGAIKLGDYDGTLYDQEGCVILINHFGQASTSGVTLNNTKAFGLMMMGPKNTYCVSGPMFNANTILKYCTLINFQWPQSGQLTDTIFIGGTYGTRGGQTLSRYTCIGQSSCAVWINPSASNTINNQFTISNVKVVHKKSTPAVLYSYDYAYAADRYSRLINFDLSETTNPKYSKGDSYTAYTNIVSFAFSVDLKVVDISGNNIQDATVTFYDNAGNTLHTYTTDSNGLVSNQFCDFRKTTSDGNLTLYFDTEANWTNLYPITIKITKLGYETYTGILLKTYSRADELLKTGLKTSITLKPSPLAILNSNGEAYQIVNNDLGTTSRVSTVLTRIN